MDPPHKALKSVVFFYTISDEFVLKPDSQLLE